MLFVRKFYRRLILLIMLAVYVIGLVGCGTSSESYQENIFLPNTGDEMNILPTQSTKPVVNQGATNTTTNAQIQLFHTFMDALLSGNYEQLSRCLGVDWEQCKDFFMNERFQEFQRQYGDLRQFVQITRIQYAPLSGNDLRSAEKSLKTQLLGGTRIQFDYSYEDIEEIGAVGFRVRLTDPETGAIDEGSSFVGMVKTNKGWFACSLDL